MELRRYGQVGGSWSKVVGALAVQSSGQVEKNRSWPCGENRGGGSHLHDAESGLARLSSTGRVEGVHGPVEGLPGSSEAHDHVHHGEMAEEESRNPGTYGGCTGWNATRPSTRASWRGTSPPA